MGSVSFDTPKSASIYDVHVTGTLPAHSSGYVRLNLSVTNTGTYTRSDSFYREIDVSNSTYTNSAFAQTYSLAIVPALYGSDTVQSTTKFSLK